MKKLSLLSFIFGLIIFLGVFVPWVTLIVFGVYTGIISTIFVIVFWLFVILALVFGILALFKKPKGRDFVFALVGIASALFVIISFVLALYSIAHFD